MDTRKSMLRNTQPRRYSIAVISHSLVSASISMLGNPYSSASARRLMVDSPDTQLTSMFRCLQFHQYERVSIRIGQITFSALSSGGLLHLKPCTRWGGTCKSHAPHPTVTRHHGARSLALLIVLGCLLNFHASDRLLGKPSERFLDTRCEMWRRHRILSG